MALRWSKTEGAYRKWSFIFTKPLPFKVDSNAPISDASYIRDVIAYAHEHDLPGKDWYQKVTVSPVEDGTVLIKAKKGTDLEDTRKYPTYTIFDILKMLGDDEINNGFRCHITDKVIEIKEMLQGFEQWDVLELDPYTIEFRLREEVANGG